MSEFIKKYVFYDFMNVNVRSGDFNKNPRCFACNDLTILGAGDNGKPIPSKMLLEEHRNIDEITESNHNKQKPNEKK
jgi:hypothetical protein